LRVKQESPTVSLRIYQPGGESPSVANQAIGPQRPFADIIDAYLIERGTLAEAGQIKPKRWGNERRHLISFRTLCGHYREGDKAPRTILAQWLLANPQWKKPDTKRDAVNTICAAFDWAADPDGVNMIDRCLFKRSKMSSLVPPCEPRAAVYVHQLLAVFRVARRRGHRIARDAFRLALHQLFETGCRPCEMRVSGWEHLDWETGIIRLPPELTKTGKATNKQRLIVLTGRMLRLLRTLWERRGRPTQGAIFINGRGDPMQDTGFADYFRRVANLAGIPKECTAAGLRHGFAIKHLSDHKSNKRVADLMGHSSTAMIDKVYDRHLREEDLIRTLRGKK
jgi:integrase